MSVTDSFAGLKEKLGALALGMFDGVHLGHAAILSRAMSVARQKGLLSAVMTFRPHPVAFFGYDLPLLSGPQQSRRHMYSSGIDIIVEHPFTAAIATMTPDEFVDYLAASLSGVDLVAGFNYTFGRNGLGTLHSLRELGESYGMIVHEIGPVQAGGITVSSTRIRRLVEEGRLQAARELLGHEFALEGLVVRGDGRGSKLGFPTANIRFDYTPVLPPYGVYLVRSPEAGFGVSNLGVRPTYPLQMPQLETFFLDSQTGNLYGRTLEVELIDFIRPEMSFASADELVSKVRHDIAVAREHILRFS